MAFDPSALSPSDRKLAGFMGDAAFQKLKRYGRILQVRGQDGKLDTYIPRGVVARSSPPPAPPGARPHRLREGGRGTNPLSDISIILTSPSPPNRLRFSSGDHPSTEAERIRRALTTKRARLVELAR